MPNSINSGAGMDFQVQHNGESKFTRMTRKLLKPKGEASSSEERYGRELRDPPRFSASHHHSHFGLANRSLRSSNSVSQRSSKPPETYQDYSEPLVLKASQLDHDEKRRGSKQSDFPQSNPNSSIEATHPSEDILEPVTKPQAPAAPHQPKSASEYLSKPESDQAIRAVDVTRPQTNPFQNTANPDLRALSSFPASATGETPNDENVTGTTNGIGGISGLQETQSLKAEIVQLRKEREILQHERDDARRKYHEVDNSYNKLEQDLTRRNSEKLQLESAVSQMEKRKDLEFQQAHKAFLKEREEWQRGAKVEVQLRRDIGDLQSQLRTAKGDVTLLKQFKLGYHALEKTLELKIPELNERDAELERQKKLYEDLQDKYGAASDELNRMKLESRAILDDRFFTTRWYELQSDIKQWADQYFWGPKRKNMLVQRPQDHPVIHEDLLRLSDDSKSLLLRCEDGSGRSNIAEAFLWNFIKDIILDSNPSDYSKGFFWAHSQRSELCRLEQFLRPGDNCTEAELRMFQKWKASTAKLLISRLRPPAEKGRIPVHPGDLDYLISHALGVLNPWRTGDERDCIRDLRRIVISAIDIDSHMNEQWSLLYTVTGPLEKVSKERHGFLFDSYLMETSNKDFLMTDNQPVGIVISPALIRAGTSNGDHYDSTWVLVKSRVLPQGVVSSTLKSKNSSKIRPGMMKGRNSEP